VSSVNEKKKQVAEFAYHNVPFYQNLVPDFPEHFEDLPIIDKEKMIQGLGQNLAPEYMMDYLAERLEKVMTSGSTGQFLTIYWDKSQQRKSLTELWIRRKKYYKIMPSDKHCFFYTTRVIEGNCVPKIEHENCIGFSKLGLSEKRLVEIYHEILEYQPSWLLAQPSMIMLLIQIATKYNLPKLSSVKYVELTGERIDKAMREKIEKFFLCPIASQYGCYEANSIAYECPQGHMHVMESNVYVEVLDENECPLENKEGTVVITSLQNRVMPFVRYKIGDRGSIRKNISCKCGNCSSIIELTKARENDMVVNRDQSVMHSDIFAHAVEMVNLATENIVQYQVVQKDYEEFEISLVLDEVDEFEITKELFIHALEGFAQGKTFHFKLKDRLFPNEKTGKLAWFKSEIE